MKSLLGIILFFTFQAGAKTLECEITNSSQAGEMIRVQSEDKVQTVTYLKADQSVLNLFSQAVRAQFEIGLCAADENSASEDDVDVYSECFLKDHSGKIFFSAKLSRSAEGTVEYVVVPKSAKAYQVRIQAAACK